MKTDVNTTPEMTSTAPEMTSASTAPSQSAPLGEEELKAKYGQLYRVGITIPVDDETPQDYTYHFRRPSVPSYDRFIKTASKVGVTQAGKAFMLDAVIDEDKARLTADMEENPGIAVTIGNKLTEIMGLTEAVNLKKL